MFGCIHLCDMELVDLKLFICIFVWHDHEHIIVQYIYRLVQATTQLDVTRLLCLIPVIIYIYMYVSFFHKLCVDLVNQCPTFLQKRFEIIKKKKEKKIFG